MTIDPMTDRDRLAALRADEEARFVRERPHSAELAVEARGSLLAGVPMPWTTRWPGAFPVVVESAGRLPVSVQRLGCRAEYWF